MLIEHIILVFFGVSNIACVFWGLTERFLKEGAESRLKMADEHIDQLKQTIKAYEEKEKETETTNKSAEEILNGRYCANCSHAEFKVIPSTGIITCICTLNPVLPIIEDPGYHVCRDWHHGGGKVTIER